MLSEGGGLDKIEKDRKLTSAADASAQLSSTTKFQKTMGKSGRATIPLACQIWKTRSQSLPLRAPNDPACRGGAPSLRCNARHCGPRCIHPGKLRAHGRQERLRVGLGQPMFIKINFFLTFGQFLANFDKPVLGCIEADFAKKCYYSLESSWRDLQDLQTFAPLRIQNSANFRQTFSHFWRFIFTSSLIFYSRCPNFTN